VLLVEPEERVEPADLVELAAPVAPVGQVAQARPA